MKKTLITFSTIALSLAATVTLADNHWPNGNFFRSCSPCSIHRDKLKCFCKTESGVKQDTKLKVPQNCLYVQNINGNLTCTAFRRHHKKYKTYTVDHGPIWNQRDAQDKCPRWCHRSNGKWSGKWWGMKNIKRSACQCLAPA